MKLTIVIDSGNDDDDNEREIFAEIQGIELDEAIDRIMVAGIEDRANRVWYPPHRVKRIEYESS